MTIKNYYILKLVILIGTVIAVIAIIFGFMYGKTRAGMIAFGDADKWQYINESFAATIDKIEIDIVSYPIFIETHDSDEISVEATIRNSRYDNPLIVDVFGKTLEIKQVKKNNINFGFVPFVSGWGGSIFGSGSILIKVPADAQYDYDIELVSADVEMYAMGKDMVLETVSGDIELFAPIENLNAETVSGNIKVTADRFSREFQFDTVSGDIYISLRDNSGYTIDFEAISGSVIDEHNNRTSSRETFYSSGDGSLEITADTISGNVRLADWH